MGKAIKWGNENDGDNRMRREVAEATKASRRTILESTDSQTGETYLLDSWVSAYWKASHQADSGSAGLVFMLFPDEIVEKLRDADASKAEVIDVYAVQYGDWASPQRTPWKGQKVIIRAFMKEISGKPKLALEMKWEAAKRQTGWHLLGLVGEKATPYLLPGHTREMRIYSTGFKQGVTSLVKLFDLSLSQEKINNYLNSP
jgi:hypothetical protein